MNLLKSVLSTATLTLAATAAFAFPVDLDSVNGQWVNASGGQSVNGEGTSLISWGSTHQQSGYGFTGNGQLPATITDSSPFVLGTFTHYNFAIPAGTAIDSVDLDVYAGFSVGNGATVTGPFTFSFQHDETLNNAAVQHCGFWCALAAKWFGIDKSYTTYNGPVDDIVGVTFDQNLTSEFVLDSKAYSLNLLGFEGNASEFQTAEHETTSVNLLASLSVREVPEPGTLALLSLGLIGLSLARGRRST